MNDFKKTRKRYWIQFFKERPYPSRGIKGVHAAPKYGIVNGKPARIPDDLRNVFIWHVNMKGYALVNRPNCMAYACPCEELEHRNWD